MVDLRVRGGGAETPLHRVPRGESRAWKPSTARSPAAPARRRSSSSRSACSKATRPTSGRRSPASRSRAMRAAAWSAASRRSSRASDLRTRGCTRRSSGRSCATASRTGSRPARTAATSSGSTSGCSRRPASPPPSSGYTLAAFLADLEKVKASGAMPLCLGGKDRFTTVELFENTLLSSIGTGGWADMVGDDLDWRGGQVQAALKRFGTMLGYTDPQASELTWDQATKKLAAGGCAFESMNDSAFGELVAAGAKEGEDFGATAVPRDRRQLPRGRRRLRGGDEGARTPRTRSRSSAASASPPPSSAFHAAKGSVPVVRDVDVSSLDRLSASGLEGPVVGAGAALGRARRGDEPGVPGRLLRRGVDVHPDAQRRRVRRRPRGRGLQGQAAPALSLRGATAPIRRSASPGAPGARRRGRGRPSRCRRRPGRRSAAAAGSGSRRPRRGRGAARRRSATDQ